MRSKRIFTALSFNHVAIAILGLGVFPVLAYPVQKMIPTVEENKREAQRKLAFLFSVIGYSGTFLYGLIGRADRSVRMIFGTYFLSVILLTLWNKTCHLRASGHACSSFAPAILITYFVDLVTGLPFVVLFIGSVWASLYLKRHKPLDILLGCLTALAAFGIALFLCR